MNKTLHQKLSDKSEYAISADLLRSNEAMLPQHHLEKEVARELLSDLLSPRPQAINRLLELSRTI